MSTACAPQRHCVYAACALCVRRMCTTCAPCVRRMCTTKVERLLELGANPDNAGLGIGMCPIHLASGPCDGAVHVEKLLQLLLRGRANTEARDQEGQLVESAVFVGPQLATPAAWDARLRGWALHALQMSAPAQPRRPCGGSTWRLCQPVPTSLMFTLSCHTQEGATALHIVAHFNKPQRAEMLIKAGAHVTALDGQQRTPLMRARAAGNQECVALLLEAETAAEVKAKESIEAQKALVIAVTRANEESSRLKEMKAVDVAEAEAALSDYLTEFPEQLSQHIWEQLSEVSDELKEQIKCHLPAAQGTPALQQAGRWRLIC